MDFHGDGGSLNHTNLIEYIQKQLPGELTTLVNLQAELAQRQGALSAVAEANADREKAKQILADASAQADSMLSNAKATLANVKAKQQTLDALEAALTARTVDFNASSEKQTAELDAQAKLQAAKATDLAKQQTQLDEANEALAQDRATLEARIKAFQDKVAAINI